MESTVHPPAKREIILKFPDRNIELVRSTVPLQFTLIIITVIISSLTFFSFLLFSSLLGLLTSTLIIALILFFALVSIFITVRQYTSTRYTLQPGYVEKTNNEMFTEVSGKVVITNGFITTITNVMQTKDLDRVDITKSVLGNYFNYGSIHLHQTDTLTEAGDYILQFVKEPEKVASYIQKMISLDTTESQFKT